MIYKVLDLSTAHVSKATANRMDVEDVEITVYPIGEFGWLVSTGCHTDLAEDELARMPADLVRVLEYAARQDCVYVRFDRDGDTVDALPKWEW